MKVVFAGTPQFAVPCLQALIDDNYVIVGVYTQPDRPAGRGQQLVSSPIKQLAQHYQLPIYQPVTLRDETQQRILAALQPDLMIVIAYGLLLPKAVLDIPRYGCINVHASLLPRWRGAAPIQRAILTGDKETGISIMQMDEGLDTGAVWYQQACPITADDTSATLHDRLSVMGAQTLLITLKGIREQTLTLRAQDSTQACYAKKINKEEARIDWQQSAIDIENIVRAFNPSPVAYSTLQQHVVRIWQAKAMDSNENTTPGLILKMVKDGIDVATKKGVLRLLKLQLAGGRVLDVKDFLNGKHDFFITGVCFE